MIDWPTPGLGKSLPGTGTQPVIDRFAYEMPTTPTPAPGRSLPGAGTQPVTDRFEFEIPTLTYPGPGRPLLGTGTQPVTDLFAYELPTLPTSGHGRQPPRTWTQPVLDWFMDDPPDMPTLVHRYDQLPPKTELYEYRPPEADLMDTVMQLQFEVDMLKFVQSGPSTSAMKAQLVQSKPVAFTSTKVPKFSGVTSWDQYRQVFDAIVQSNGWDDATVALQLLSHLEGDALNGALLVSEAKRATQAGLVGALAEHYSSPGRLADYRCQFKKTTRHEGEDLSIFTIALETLTIKALGDMGRKRDYSSYGTGSSLVTRTVPCGVMSIAFRRRLPSGTLLTDIECERAMQTRVPGEL